MKLLTIELLEINDHIFWSCMLQNERYLPIKRD